MRFHLINYERDELMHLDKKTIVFFEKFRHIYKGEIEKELVNTYILSVETNDRRFNEIYHGRIAVGKNKCYSTKGEILLK